jgi:hypothetical protein
MISPTVKPVGLLIVIGELEVVAVVAVPLCAIWAFKAEKEKVNTKRSRNFFIINTLLVYAANATFEDDNIFKKGRLVDLNCYSILLLISSILKRKP